MSKLFKIVSKSHYNEWTDSRATIRKGKTYYGFMKDSWYYILMDNCRITNLNNYYFETIFDLTTKEFVNDKEFEFITEICSLKDSTYKDMLCMLNLSDVNITEKSITLFTRFTDLSIDGNVKFLLELVSRLKKEEE